MRERRQWLEGWSIYVDDAWALTVRPASGFGGVVAGDAWGPLVRSGLGLSSVRVSWGQVDEEYCRLAVCEPGRRAGEWVCHVFSASGDPNKIERQISEAWGLSEWRAIHGALVGVGASSELIDVMAFAITPQVDLFAGAT